MHFRQAIKTKYLGPTNTKGSRVSAQCDAKIRYYDWRSELNVDDNHLHAAMDLFKELGWPGTLVGGSIKNEYVFVSVQQVGSGLLRAWE